MAVFAVLALVALIYLLSPMSQPDEPLLYLIGVNHAVQFKPAMSQMFSESESVQKKREAFKAHVAEMIDKLDIEVLAEEFGDEGKKESEIREFMKDFAQAVHEPFDWEIARLQFDWETELQKFRKAKGIGHRFCDPDSIEKQALGIEVDPLPLIIHHVIVERRGRDVLHPAVHKIGDGDLRVLLPRIFEAGLR